MVTLSDNTLISRTRAPGAGTQLEVTSPGGEGFRGQEAQRAIERTLGLSLEDFRSTSWLAQGEAAAIVRGDPATRTAMVSRWLGIEALERSLVIARRRIATATNEITGTRAKLEAWRERKSKTGIEDPRVFGELVRAAEASLVEWGELLALANQEAAGSRLQEERIKIRRERDELLTALARQDPDELLCEKLAASRARDAAHERLQTAKTRLVNRAAVASGTFGGRCPVAGIPCPATQEINGLARASRDAADEAEAAEEHWRVAGEGFQAASRVLVEAERRVASRGALEERARVLQERLDGLVGPESPGVSSGLVLEAVAEQRDRAARELEGLRWGARELETADREIEGLLGVERLHGAVLETAREGAALLARAPRRIAERVLGVVAESANRVLREAGVELSLEVSWERASREPADTCEACGAAFPRSARIKACESCREPRGTRKIRRLDVELSARSGAAEDLAGLALSLAAGSWLRGERGSAFGVLLGDELSAQLDVSHRRAMSARLARDAPGAPGSSRRSWSRTTARAWRRV